MYIFFSNLYLMNHELALINFKIELRTSNWDYPLCYKHTQFEVEHFEIN